MYWYLYFLSVIKIRSVHFWGRIDTGNREQALNRAAHFTYHYGLIGIYISFFEPDQAIIFYDIDAIG